MKHSDETLIKVSNYIMVMHHHDEYHTHIDRCIIYFVTHKKGNVFHRVDSVTVNFYEKIETQFKLSVPTMRNTGAVRDPELFKF